MIYTRNGAIVQLPAMGVLGTDMDDAAQQNVPGSRLIERRVTSSLALQPHHHKDPRQTHPKVKLTS